MKKDFIYKFIIFWILLLTFVFTIISDNRNQNLHQKINDIEKVFSDIKKNNAELIKTVNIQKRELQKYIQENNELKNERDSILLSAKKQNTIYRAKLQKFKSEQKKTDKLIKNLRKQNKIFE